MQVDIYSYSYLRNERGNEMTNESRTYSSVIGDCKCECADSLCAHHIGKSDCRDVASQYLYRVDMQDVTGTAMCDACAEDAMESGLFTDSTDDEDETETHTLPSLVFMELSAPLCSQVTT